MGQEDDRLIVDAMIANHAGLFVVHPQTARALAWLQRHAAAESWQWHDGGLVIDGASYARPLVEAMMVEGLTVTDAPAEPRVEGRDSQPSKEV